MQNPLRSLFSTGSSDFASPSEFALARAGSRATAVLWFFFKKRCCCGGGARAVILCYVMLGFFSYFSYCTRGNLRHTWQLKEKKELLPY